MLNRHIAALHRRRKNIADILDNAAKHLQSIANLNVDILDIEEATRLVSLVSLLQKLSADLTQTIAMED